MPSAKVTSKGQITIPAEVRKALGLKPGVRIDFFQNADGEFVLSPKTGSIRDLKGCVPKLDYVPTIEEINDAIGAAAAESYLRSIGQSSTDKSKDEAA
ncbi:MAG: AbrB/MazE/SpoVT family DNA-binding domain-containing protein [Terracidiphilus sp.]|jgi:antitoxin PrlF